jgi:chromosomal replication initiator protein
LDSRKLWQAVLGELEMSVSRANYATWFKDTTIINHGIDHITIAVPNIITKETLKKRFEDKIKDCLEGMDTKITAIDYKVISKPQAVTIIENPLVKTVSGRPEAAQIARAAFAVSATGTTIDAPTPPTITAQPPSSSRNPASYQLNPRYTLDSFVVGSSNELAYVTSQTVAKYPGDKYNPLFLYGGVGLGKTHLMQAIGNEIVRRNPSCRIRYITSEEFTNEFIDSLQRRKTKAFAQTYRSLDVLIVDDIQFIGSKEKTQEEFFHTFNTLHQAGKQIIMSSDKRPRDIPHLEARLRSRFEMGMSADIQRPDLETRSAIVQRKALQENVKLPTELVEFLARQYQHNIRELEGALTQLVAYCEVRGIEPSIIVAKGLSGGVVPRRRTLTATTIIEKTAAYFNLQPSDITGSKRDKDIVVPRQIAMYLIHEELGLSYPKIAVALGKRDHTTAIHSVRKIERLIEVDDDLRSEVNHIKERISL